MAAVSAMPTRPGNNNLRVMLLQKRLRHVRSSACAVDTKDSNPALRKAEALRDRVAAAFSTHGEAATIAEGVDGVPVTAGIRSADRCGRRPG
jgi:hypothetical protein